MPAKRILTHSTIIASVAIAFCCVAGCRRPQADRLQFVGCDKPLLSESAGKSLVVITHGWIEQGQGSWPEDMAVAIYKRTELNVWLCGYFDWTEGAKTLNATSAAKYARDVAGPKLAEEILKLKIDFKHIHLIAHSGGCWAVSEAAKILAAKTKSDIHLTFLDAYVSVFWDESSLGDVNTAADVSFWAEHYYTRDYTLGWTQCDLSNAHNVNVTDIDQGLKDHNFPWQWYYATISGKYPKDSFCDDDEIFRIANGLGYGFARSREAADPNSWNRSLKLPTGNKGVRFREGR